MYKGYQYVLLRLREERERLNLTQRQLCGCMKMQQSHFSKAETGHRYFSFHELKGLCCSDVDVLYLFTGRRAGGLLTLPGIPDTAPEEPACCLGIVYGISRTAQTLHRDRTSLGQARQLLEYIQYGNSKTNIFLAIRNHYGHTQKKMADALGMDIKKLRELEKGRLLPDSGILWKMYDSFHVSPVFLLRDARGLWNELDYVLGQMTESDRETMLQILENAHRLIQARPGADPYRW